MSKSHIQSSCIATTQSCWEQKDQKLEKQLRPQDFPDFIGQKKVLDRLEVFIGAAKKRGEPPLHILFYGPAGLGKTTLSYIVSKTSNAPLVTISGPSIEKPADLAGILTSLPEGGILFIDEIHRLSRAVEEYLYTAMEDFKLDLLLDTGPQTRAVEVKLHRFTLIGATTRVGMLSSPLRSRFSFTCRLDYYDHTLLEKILFRSASILSIEIDPSSAQEIAKRSRGTPRIANNLLRWVRDYAQMRNQNQLDNVATRTALEMLDIDHLGLDQMDTKLLEIIIDHHQGGPVGINTLATALGEAPSTLEEVHEPFLIMQGLLRRTARGREATKNAYHHLGRVFQPNHDGVHG